jgi:D-3-phosphoglycerate dehydrogenase / 2-oxoglutarate reductase
MTKGLTILITAPAHNWLMETLSSSGYNVLYRPSLTDEELKDTIGTVHGLVVTTRLKIDKTVIDRASQLKWIGRLGSGMELIDEPYATSRGIRCISTPEGNRNAVAEHTLALLLNLMNNVSKSFTEIRQGQWLRNENRGVELSGKTVGVIGYGNMGSSFVRLLQPFEVSVLVYDKYKTGFGNAWIEEATLEQVCANSDVISLHIPLTGESRHFANDAFFDCLQRKPYFITTCRGPVTETAALIRALKNGKLSGAGLDVLENEKLSSYTPREQEQLDFLCSQPNVVLSPHVAGYSFEAFLRMSEVLIEKLRFHALI